MRVVDIYSLGMPCYDHPNYYSYPSFRKIEETLVYRYETERYSDVGDSYETDWQVLIEGMDVSEVISLLLKDVTHWDNKHPSSKWTEAEIINALTKCIDETLTSKNHSSHYYHADCVSIDMHVARQEWIGIHISVWKGEWERL